MCIRDRVSPTNNVHLSKANAGGDVSLRITNATNQNSGSTASLYFTTSPTVDFNTAYIQAVRDGGKLNFGYHSQSPTVCMRISTGNVGIGTSDPTPTDSAYDTACLHIHQATNSSSKGSQVHLTTANSGSAAGDGSQLSQYNNWLYINNQDSGGIQFHANGSERARITSSGEWMVGTTSSSPDTASTVSGMTYSSSKLRVARNGDACLAVNRNSSTGDIVQLNYNGTQRGSIQTDGTVIAFNTGSDYRLKENEVALTDGITKVKQLKPYTFNFKDSPNKIDQGFFAHEVQPVVPGAVSGTKDAVHSEDKDSDGIKAGDIDAQQMDYAKLTPLLTAALQEAITKIETLEAKVAALESA